MSVKLNITKFFECLETCALHLINFHTTTWKYEFAKCPQKIDAYIETTNFLRKKKVFEKNFFKCFFEK